MSLFITLKSNSRQCFELFDLGESQSVGTELNFRLIRLGKNIKYLTVNSERNVFYRHSLS